MVFVVRNGSGVGCEPIDRNILAGSSPVFHPKYRRVIRVGLSEAVLKTVNP